MTIEERKSELKERPLGISIITFLYIMKGFIGLLVLLLIPSKETQNSIEIGMEYAERLVYFVIGIGLLLGKNGLGGLLRY